MKKRVLSMVMTVLLMSLLLTGVTLADDAAGASAAAEETWTTVSDASGLLDAIRNAASSTEAAPARIKLLNDIAFDAAGSSSNGDIEIRSGYIILDLNGCSITGSGAYSVIYLAGGTLYLQDTALTTQYLEDIEPQSLPDELFDANGSFQAAVLENESSAGHTTWTTYYCSVKTDSNGDPVLDSEGNVQLIYCSYTSGAVTGGGLTASVSFGGGVALASGSLRISDSIINNNQAGQGGGLHLCSNAEITGCLIANNSASSMDGFDGDLCGGGILLYTGGKLSVSDSTISGNSAERGGGLVSDGVLTISNTMISDNRATVSGGGVYLFSSGSITMQAGSSVTGNKASFRGGGIYNYGGTVIVTYESSILQNSAPSGADTYDATYE